MEHVIAQTPGHQVLEVKTHNKRLEIFPTLCFIVVRNHQYISIAYFITVIALQFPNNLELSY